MFHIDAPHMSRGRRRPQIVNFYSISEYDKSYIMLVCNNTRYLLGRTSGPL
jgi:hypothetical protein